MMQIARFLIEYGMVSVLGVFVSVFLAQNTQAERLTFFGQEVSTSLAWIMVGATVAGFLFALLLLLPGRVAATFHIWTLRKEARELDEELVWQSEQRDQLLAHHEQLLDGHEWLLSVYRRTCGELDHIVRERDTLQVRLAHANDALVQQRAALAQRQSTVPSRPRQMNEVLLPTAPRGRVVRSVPVVTALTSSDDVDDGEEEKTPFAEAQTPLTPADATPGVLQRTQSAAVIEESARDGHGAAHASATARATLATALEQFLGACDRRRQALWSWSKALWSEGVQRIEQIIIQVRQGGIMAWDTLRERASSLGLKNVDADRRVPPATHPR
jgi:uncharacterized integral membrane protein